MILLIKLHSYNISKLLGCLRLVRLSFSFSLSLLWTPDIMHMCALMFMDFHTHASMVWNCLNSYFIIIFLFLLFDPCLTEMWLSTMRALPLASQEASGAIEAYHVKLKAKLFDDSHLGALQRVDWLVHKLTTELHSSYWLDRYADESDSFLNVKEEYVASTSWHRALQIADNAVTVDDKDQLFAKVSSQKDNNLTHTVWNPGSEFAFCDCAWSLQGNLCKHVIKVNMMCENRQGYQSSMSFQSFKEILTSLRKKQTDDSVSLDLLMAWTHQMLEQIKQLVELNSSSNISSVVNNMPLKWVSKKGRTSFGIPSSIPILPSTSKTSTKTVAARPRNRKRKRL